eukprot:132040-Pyramimonas_sp.AAC.2
MGIYPTQEPIAAQGWVYTRRRSQSQCMDGYIPDAGANRSAGMGIYPTQEPITAQGWVYTRRRSQSQRMD